MSFKTTNYLLFDKRKKDLDNELLEEFNPFVTTKTFSFYENGKMVDYINHTLNMYGNLFKTKEEQFRFFENIIPIQQRKKIQYLKKPKVETDHIPRREYE